jgi:hypothetical protein
MRLRAVPFDESPLNAKVPGKRPALEFILEAVS